MLCYKDGKDCPYKETCKNKTSDGSCSKMCVIFNEINIMMYNAGIPKKYIQPYKLFPDKDDIDGYDVLNEIRKNIISAVDEGFNLYIQSYIKGNGKTSWGIKILQNYLHNLIGKPGSKKRGMYMDVGLYMRELKLSFDSKDKKVSEFGIDINSADLLVLDHIDEVRLSEWERNYLKLLIRKRLSNNLTNIFIGNNLGNKLSAIVGEDLKYYIQDNSIVISLYGNRGVSK